MLKVARVMQRFEPLMRQRKFKEAESVLDEAIKSGYADREILDDQAFASLSGNRDFRAMAVQIRKRLKERPDAFRTLAELDDSTIDEVLAHIDSTQKKKTPPKN